MAPAQQIKLWELAGEDSQISISPLAGRLENTSLDNHLKPLDDG